MTRLLVDTNIVLDLLAKRKEFAAAAKLFTLGDKGEVKLFVSALTFANAYYMLTRQLDRVTAVRVLRDLESLITIIDLSSKVVKLALNDEEFTDFEDGLQYYSAVGSEMEIIVTRNQKYFKHSQLPVLSAEEYLKSLEKGNTSPAGRA